MSLPPSVSLLISQLSTFIFRKASYAFRRNCSLDSTKTSSSGKSLKLFNFSSLYFVKFISLLSLMKNARITNPFPSLFWKFTLFFPLTSWGSHNLVVILRILYYLLVVKIRNNVSLWFLTWNEWHWNTISPTLEDILVILSLWEACFLFLLIYGVVVEFILYLILKILCTLSDCGISSR